MIDRDKVGGVITGKIKVIVDEEDTSVERGNSQRNARASTADENDLACLL